MCTRVSVCACVYVYVCRCAFGRACMYAHTHIHIYIYIYTYIYIYVYRYNIRPGPSNPFWRVNGRKERFFACPAATHMCTTAIQLFTFVCSIFVLVNLALLNFISFVLSVAFCSFHLFLSINGCGYICFVDFISPSCCLFWFQLFQFSSYICCHKSQKELKHYKCHQKKIYNLYRIGITCFPLGGSISDEIPKSALRTSQVHPKYIPKTC